LLLYRYTRSEIDTQAIVKTLPDIQKWNFSAEGAGRGRWYWCALFCSLVEYVEMSDSVPVIEENSGVSVIGTSLDSARIAHCQWQSA
jgi:hypothetical protein